MATKKNVTRMPRKTSRATTKGKSAKKVAKPAKQATAKKNAVAKTNAAKAAVAKPATDLQLELAKLAVMGTDELQDLYRDTFGKPTKSNNLPHLRAILAKALADVARGEKPQAEGDEKEPLAKREVPKVEGSRDPRLPTVGATIERRYKDEVIKVKVLADGFQCRGQHHKSLSALAKTFTGCATNGFVWFGLGGSVKAPSAEA